MRLRRSLLWLLVGFVFFLALITAGSFLVPPAEPLFPITLESPDGEKIALKVERAITPSQQARGLMFRNSVRHGMLFVFEQEKPLAFWMKNTLVPLDILFFDDAGIYISSTTMEPCTADPCPTYASAAPARSALEMPAGFLLTKGIEKGWKIGW